MNNEPVLCYDPLCEIHNGPPRQRLETFLADRFGLRLVDSELDELILAVKKLIEAEKFQ